MQTTKRIKITLADGRIYSVSGHDVADNRAIYYSSRDSSTTYQEEYDFAIADDYELKDWLFGNMDWWTEKSLKLESRELSNPQDVEVLDKEVVDE